MNLDNNPFEYCLLQKLIDNIHIRSIGVKSIFINNYRFNFHDSVLCREDRNYVMSIVPSMGISRSNETVIMIFDKEDKRLVADIKLYDISIKEVGELVYTIARKNIKNLEILIPRSGMGVSLLESLLNTEIRSDILFRKVDKEIVIPGLSPSRVLEKTPTRKVNEYGIQDNLHAYNTNCELLKNLVRDEADAASSSNDLYLFSPLIVEDIIALEVSKRGDYNLTNSLKAFLNGMAYMTNTINGMCEKNEGDE